MICQIFKWLKQLVKARENAARKLFAKETIKKNLLLEKGRHSEKHPEFR